MKEVGADYAGVENKGITLPYVGVFLCGICAGSPVVWVRYVVYVTAHL